MRAGQPDGGVALAIGSEHALDQVEAQHLGEDLLHFGDVRPVQQGVIEAHRTDAMLARLGPGRRIDQAGAVADDGLLGVQLDQVAGGQFEAHALAGFQHVAGRDAGGGQAVGLQVGIQLLEGGLVEHLEAEEVETGAVRLADHVAVVIALVPALEVDAALRIAPGFHQAQHVPVEADAFFEIQHANLGMARPQHTCHRHLLSPLFGLMRFGCLSGSWGSPGRRSCYGRLLHCRDGANLFK
ncbi:hypothetical protein D3C86_1566270 [compost metagenome]